MKINATAKIATSFVLLLLIAATTRAAAGPVKIVDNGPDGSKLVFAILGDGYSADDQQKYQDDVANLIIEGLLGHDFYRDNRSAFNVYRVDLISKDSGVSAPEGAKNTALKLKFTDDWNTCYFESSTDTDKLIDKAVAGIDKYPDYVLVIANEARYGGCHPGGNRLYATSGSGWQVVAHEYGHGIGHLYDEYWPDDAEPHNSTQEINVLNCSTKLDKNQLSWRQFVSASLSIPPMTVLKEGMDPLTTVGMFEGCDYSPSGIYRPAFTCRMKEIESPFCPVCQAFMRNAVAPFLGSPAPPPGPVPQQHRYLNVTLRIKESGSTELLNVSQGTKLEAEAIETPTDFVFEV
ncbi:MAG TPA: M64 family metallopeptidase, partial [Pyrinomonadaceae bacterium]|nr:M64 family metallopeptidase [Pyrinomonadaceae bacterium]